MPAADMGAWMGTKRTWEKVAVAGYAGRAPVNDAPAIATG